MIPDSVEVEGRDWPIRRAWPERHGRIAIEAEHEGRIRVGVLAAGRTALLPAGQDPELPGLSRVLGEDSDGTTAHRLISHRPGRRAVVRLADGTFVKCVRPGKAGAVLDGIERALPFAAVFRMPEVLAADDSAVVFSALRGTELHDPSSFSPDQWAHAWSQVLAAWMRAGDTSACDPSGASGLVTHSAHDEVRILRRWQDRARPHLDRLLDGPELRALDREIAAVEEELSAPAGVEGPLHRDLHDKQLMWDPDLGPGLLDVDTACRGERALDLGNLRAHALWRRRQGIWSDDHAEVVLAEIAAAASALRAGEARVDVYTRAALLRLVCVYAFRPRWRTRIGALLEDVRSSVPGRRGTPR